MSAKDIFLKAIEIDSSEERRAFVDQACDGNTKMRRRVEALLAAHDDPDSYLERPAARFDVTATHDGEDSGSESVRFIIAPRSIPARHKGGESLPNRVDAGPRRHG